MTHILEKSLSKNNTKDTQTPTHVFDGACSPEKEKQIVDIFKNAQNGAKFMYEVVSTSGEVSYVEFLKWEQWLRYYSHDGNFTLTERQKQQFFTNWKDGDRSVQYLFGDPEKKITKLSIILPENNNQQLSVVSDKVNEILKWEPLGVSQMNTMSTSYHWIQKEAEILKKFSWNSKRVQNALNMSADRYHDKLIQDVVDSIKLLDQIDERGVVYISSTNIAWEKQKNGSYMKLEDYPGNNSLLFYTDGKRQTKQEVIADIVKWHNHEDERLTKWKYNNAGNIALERLNITLWTQENQKGDMIQKETILEEDIENTRKKIQTESNFMKKWRSVFSKSKIQKLVWWAKNANKSEEKNEKNLSGNTVSTLWKNLWNKVVWYLESKQKETRENKNLDAMQQDLNNEVQKFDSILGEMKQKTIDLEETWNHIVTMNRMLEDARNGEGISMSPATMKNIEETLEKTKAIYHQARRMKKK